MRIEIRNEINAVSVDSGWYHDYVGPVKAKAPSSCVQETVFARTPSGDALVYHQTPWHLCS